LPPDLESLPHFPAIYWGRELVAPRSEVLGNKTISSEKALGVSRGFKALQAPLALAGRLVGVFGAVVEVAVLAMFYTR
jgi:hypothetical protein